MGAAEPSTMTRALPVPRAGASLQHVTAMPHTRREALRLLRDRRAALRTGRWGSAEEATIYKSSTHSVADELRKVEERMAAIKALL